MTVAQHVLTLETFLAQPETKPGLEFEEGSVTQKVSPKGPHSTLQVVIASWFNATPGRQVFAFTELRVTFGDRSYIPDISVYRRERIPRAATGEVAESFTEPPDIAIEVVSPEQGVNALIRRCLWFVTHGVQVALLVDPRDRSVVLICPNTLPLVLRGPDRPDFGQIIPGLTAAITIEERFASLLLP